MRVTLLAALLFVVAACGASAAPTTGSNNPLHVHINTPGYGFANGICTIGAVATIYDKEGNALDPRGYTFHWYDGKSAKGSPFSEEESTQIVVAVGKIRTVTVTAQDFPDSPILQATDSRTCSPNNNP